MKVRIPVYMLFILIPFISVKLDAQIFIIKDIPSEQGRNLETLNHLPQKLMPTFDINQMKEEDKEQEGKIDKPFRFAKVFDVNINIKAEGLSETIDNQGTIWRLRIKSIGAFSINLTFGKFKLPQGSELFIYNMDKSQKYGAFTDGNNNSSDILPVLPIKGDEIVIEYFEPTKVEYLGQVVLTKIGHDYINVLNKNKLFDGQFGTSQECNKDINCSEAANWQEDKNSVCRILINNSELCTGSLMNNGNINGTPYVLTANHCISDNNTANNSVFVFNYESPYCDGPDGSVSHSISVATLRSTWSTSDFTLVELSSAPPICYQPSYNGWDNSGSTPSSVACIHHPSGDVKKYSYDNSTPTTDGTYLWKVTDYYIGTVEHGSSGAPLYNSSHRVVGQVHGGNNIFCNSSEYSTYGKFSESWEGGGTSTSQLKYWLDPNDEDLTYLERYQPYNPTLTGTDIVCSSGSYFTVNNLPTEDTVFWNSSENLSRISSQNSNPCEFQPTVDGYSGWVRATIHAACGVIELPIKNVWLGSPSQPTGINNFAYNGKEFGSDSNYEFRVNCSNNQGIDDYEWVVGGGTITEGQGTNTIIVHTDEVLEGSEYFNVTVRTGNDCGWSSYFGRSGYVVPGSGGEWFVVYPNPSESIISISVSNDLKMLKSELNPIDKISIRNLEIYDNNGVKVKSDQFGAGVKSATLDIASLRPGVYSIKIFCGEKEETHTLIKK
jgi:lysyl endopeptidase